LAVLGLGASASAGSIKDIKHVVLLYVHLAVGFGAVRRAIGSSNGPSTFITPRELMLICRSMQENRAFDHVQ
jgi:phospholipase C